MVREIHGAKINTKSPFKFRVRKIRGGANYVIKYGTYRKNFKKLVLSAVY
jgi:hypothetical protein